MNDANYSEIYNYVSSSSIEENQDIIGDNIYDELMIIFLISEIKTISMHLLHIKKSIEDLYEVILYLIILIKFNYFYES